MIKGVYKNTVIIKSPDSIIEEAIFIIKPSAMKGTAVDNDAVLREITKILNEKTGLGASSSRRAPSVDIRKNRK